MVLLSNSSQLIGAVFAAATALLYAARQQSLSQTRRIAWLLIGLSNVAWVLGQGSYLLITT